MGFHRILLIVHLICASIWVGGHIFLSLSVLHKALKEKNTSVILNFERSYEKVGVPALVILVITGVLMSFDFGIYPSNWFEFSPGMERVISIKLILLLCTITFAIIANIVFIPQLKKSSIKALKKMAFLIIGVTLIAITMLILGNSLRYGGF